MRTMIACVAVATAAAAWSARAAEFWVDQNANANATGTADAPFKTIGEALHAAGAGDTVIVRGGVYRERLAEFPAGTAEKPFTLKAAPGQRVVLSGAVPVTEWKATEAGVYSAIVPSAPVSVILDNRELPISREPNESWWTVAGATENSLTDPNQLKTLAVDDLAGAVAYVWAQKGNLFLNAPVIKLDKSAGSIEFAPGKRPAITPGDKYYLKNHPRFIDQPGEWASVPNADGTATLHLKPANDADLKRIEIPQNQAPIISLGAAQHVVLDGIEVTAGARNGIEVTGDASNVVIQNCLIHNNEYAGVFVRQVSNVTVRRSLVEGNEYGVLVMTAKDTSVEECEITGNGTDGVVFSWDSQNVTLRRSYVHDHMLWGHPDNVQVYRNVKGFRMLDNLIQMSGQSLMMEQTSGGEIAGNMFVGSAAYMLIFGHGNAEDYTLRNNTFAFAGYGCINFSGKDYRVHDNIFFTGHARPAYSVKGVAGYVADRNLFFNSPRTPGGRVLASDKAFHHSLEDFKAATSQDAASVQVDPKFRHAPVACAVLDEKLLSQSTRDTLILRPGSAAAFEAGDHVELNFDGVVRKVTKVQDNAISIDPPLEEKPIKAWLVANWLESRDFALDLRLKPDSPAITLGEGGKPAGSTIDIAAYRAGDFDGDGVRDIPARPSAKKAD